MSDKNQIQNRQPSSSTSRHHSVVVGWDQPVRDVTNLSNHFSSTSP